MPITNSVVGAGSLMPEDMYMRKYESSCIYESPSLMYDYNRNQLKKTGPVQGFFESDQKRTNYDTVGRLALRDGGKRNQSEPWLPDGTFLDHQFLEPDPRSLMVEPDMLKHREQQEARGGYYNYRSDEDFSIPEKGIHPEKLRYMMRESQNLAKSYMNIFDESLVGMQNSGPMSYNTAKPHLVDLTQFSAPYKPGFDVTQGQHAGAVTTLSNNTPIGWLQGVDHRFKVAHYGQIRGLGRVQDQDWYKNRGSATMDHEDAGYLHIEESPVPHPTAQMIVDLSEKRMMEIEGASHVKLGESEKSMTGIKRRLNQDDMTRIQAKFVKSSQAATAHEKLNQMQRNAPGLQFREADTLQRSTIINPRIIESVMQVNAKRANLDRDDLRGEIQRTAKDSGLYVSAKNTKAQGLSDPMIGRHSTEYNFKRGDDKQVHVYGLNTKQSVDPAMSKLDTSDGFGSQSKNNEMRKRNQMLGDIKTTKDFEMTGDMHEFTPHQIGKKGKMRDKARVMHYSEEDTLRDDQMSEMRSGV
jgi:hypothetical protein